MKFEVKFDEDDIKEMILAKVQAMGIPANTCLIHASYGKFDRAEVWYEEPIVAAPAAPEPEAPPVGDLGPF